METAYTIVVPDAEMLSRLCGTNDSNLDLIEKHLGVPVFTCGNELSVPDADPGVAQQFRHIIDRLLDEASEGCDVGPDLLNTILLDSSDRLSAGSFSAASVVIPGGIRKVYPKTRNQAALVHAMRRSDMVFCLGPAGSGKTFLAVAEALRLVLSHEKAGIVLTRPVVEAGENLGFLPGDLEQKINPYLRPLYDAIGALLPKETVRKLTESGAIETAPLAYMRGRTLHNSVIILDEAQNTTKEQMKMFLTRMGEGSKVFVTGDITQVDLPPRTVSGLAHAVRVLRSVPEIEIHSLTASDVVRNPLVKKIVQAYENEQTDFS
ncbi:PhoH family protein [Treponema brennaborense]|uniref:PhoH-like protein n=1 Tax=Treponema brennaborense (strain DSM 12168 / CIP 105900 / DD5/3) TaxID=906968 RepID=F4LJT8_TREBD|nr:PhoH family protein [Treponema brennaborense]AEE16418.1 PhoH family protein [Treponema brennaborense DSM 12168]